MTEPESEFDAEQVASEEAYLDQLMQQGFSAEEWANRFVVRVTRDVDYVRKIVLLPAPKRGVIFYGDFSTEYSGWRELTPADLDRMVAWWAVHRQQGQ
jgi:hypothetical protein